MEKATQLSSACKKILCVDDDRDTCELLSFLLSDYEFVFTHNLEDARNLIENQNFDLFILDNWLPDGSGVELCRKIREFQPDVAIIFTSAAGRKDDIQKAFNAGANAYLVKPCEPEELQKIIKELIKD